MQVFDRTIWFVKIFPWGCTEFPEFSNPRVLHVSQVCGHPAQTTHTYQVSIPRDISTPHRPIY